MISKNLTSITSELKQWGNLNSATTFLVKNLCEIYDWSYGEVWLPSLDGKFMTWSGYWTNDQNYFLKFSKFSSVHKFGKGIGLIGKTWQEKNPYWIDDIFTDNNFLRTEVAVQSDLKAVVCIPMFSREKVLCILCFFKNTLTAEDKTKAGEIYNHSTEIGEALIQLF